MNRLFGVISLILFAIVLALGAFAIAQSSPATAMVYILIILFFTLLIIYSFCTKCQCRHHSCGHVLPGKLAGMLPEREQTNYSFMDIFITFFSLIIILAFPQPWLYGNKYLFFCFWIIMAIGGALVTFFVCSKCENKKCPVCRKKT